jgi:hypothetical protein
MRTLAILAACGTLSLSLAAQDTTTTTTTQDNRSAGQSMKDAGHATANAAKDVGHATATGAKKVGSTTKNTTMKVVHKGAQKTEEGATKVEDKTNPQ